MPLSQATRTHPWPLRLLCALCTLWAACDEPAPHTRAELTDLAETAHLNDTPDDTPDATPAPPPFDLDRLFAEDAPVWHFELRIDDADLTWLNANAAAEHYVPGDLRFQSWDFPDVGVRYKGAYGSLHGCLAPDGALLCSKLSIAINFGKYTKNQRFFGTKKLLLHGCQRDRTCLREPVSYALFNAAGITTARTAHATLAINDAPPMLYVLVEAIDADFLRHRFPDPTGNLYKEVWPDSLDPNRYLDGLKTNTETPKVDRFVAFAEVVLGSTPAGAHALDPWIQRPAMATYNALDQLIHNWDGIYKFYCHGQTCRNHNYFIYDDPRTQRFVVIPWDLDHTWNLPDADFARAWWDDAPDACAITPLPDFPAAGVRAPQCDPLLGTLMRGDWEDYRAALAQLLDGEDTRLEAVLTRLDGARARIRPHIAVDPSAPPLPQWDAATAQLRQIIRAQYGAAAAFLAE